ncbi:hypothetical protein [Agarivorans sp. Alg241-V36]|uniref:hypothetical protein n=1 Tax=Agarivorans sp. Alg241-V36 TaxID=2305992 RepID=UPI0013D19DB0|nr:hypothetical protein [Agarivorans sp. Alg241-V36]
MKESNISYNWPSDLPSELFEELELIPAQGEVYRLVSGIPPTSEDFIRHRDTNTEYNYQNKIERLQSYGVSVWSKLTKLKRRKKNFPANSQLGQMRIVSGYLVPELGVISSESRRDGHVTLWKQVKAEPHVHIKNEVND